MAKTETKEPTFVELSDCKTFKALVARVDKLEREVAELRRRRG